MALDRMGQRYGRYPCERCGVEPDSALGLSIDLLAYEAGRIQEARELRDVKGVMPVAIVGGR